MPGWDPIHHRPWPLPTAPWVLRQDWLDLAFLHWRADADLLQSLLPSGLRLERFDGHAYVGIVPFWMSGVRPRLLPPVPGLSRFPEVNVRTYVTDGERPGVWFFSLDTPSRLAVAAGRGLFGVPYRPARQRIEDGSQRRYRSWRPELELDVSVSLGPACPAPPGSLEHFLTERYCFHAVRRDRRLRADVHHAPWPLHRAEATVAVNGLLDDYGVGDPLRPDLVHASPGVEVIAWWASPVAPQLASPPSSGDTPG